MWWSRRSLASSLLVVAAALIFAACVGKPPPLEVEPEPDLSNEQGETTSDTGTDADVQHSQDGTGDSDLDTAGADTDRIDTGETPDSALDTGMDVHDADEGPDAEMSDADTEQPDTSPNDTMETSDSTIDAVTDGGILDGGDTYEVGDGGGATLDTDGADAPETSDTVTDTRPEIVDASDTDTERDADTFDTTDGAETTVDTRPDGTGGIQTPVRWIRLLGTSHAERVYNFAIDGSGNVYVVGVSGGDLGLKTNQGLKDAFVAKYDTAGNRKWVELLGTYRYDAARDVSVDNSGDVYVVGSTHGALGNRPPQGAYDAFVTKFDPMGNRKWIELLGTKKTEGAYGVSVNSSGNVNVTGITRGNLGGHITSRNADAFVATYDSAGIRKSTNLLGVSGNHSSYHVAAKGAGNVYVIGSTKRHYGGHRNSGKTDGFVGAYDATGYRTSATLIGTPKKDTAEAVTVDGSGNLYVAGFTSGNLGGQTSNGTDDVYLVKYDSAGNRKWVRLIDTNGLTRVADVSTDRSGHVHVAGDTTGNLAGQSNRGGSDAFVASFDAAGNRKAVKLIGTSDTQTVFSVATDSSGHIYLGGETDGDLKGQTHSGDTDGFVISLPSP